MYFGCSKGILNILEILWTFGHFRSSNGYFCHFRLFNDNVLVKLRILGYFGHFGVSRGILVMFGNFDGILVMLEILRVF